MAGHARERGKGRWELRARAGVHPITGKPIIRTRTVDASGKREAQRLADDFAAEVRREPLRAGEATFGAVAEEWIAQRRATWKPSTTREHLRIVNHHLESLLDVRVDRLRTLDIDRLYAALRAGGGRDGQPLANATVRRIHVVVHAVLEQATRWGFASANVAALADKGEVDEDEVEPPSVEELAALIRAADELGSTRHAANGKSLLPPEFALFLVFAAVTGARRGALCAVRWTDLDLVGATVRFPRVISLGMDGPEERTASKRKRSSRHSALDLTTVQALAAHRVVMGERAQAASLGPAGFGFVFSDDPAGQVPWRPDNVTKRFIRARRHAGLREDFRLHDLRHFMPTFLLSQGVDGKTVATRGGWARPATMHERYAHVLEPVDRHAAGLIGGVVHQLPAAASD